MTISTQQLLLSVFLCLALMATALAKQPADNGNGGDTTHLGFDHARKIAAQKAKSSSEMVERKYNLLLNKIKRSTFPGDAEHNAKTANYLEGEHKQWIVYRDLNCSLKANIYVYPEYSRMWTSDYRSCENRMNKNRIKFLEGALHQYK